MPDRLRLQVSIHPPRFLAGLSVKNVTYRVALRAELLVVHFVPEDAEELALLFGGETGDPHRSASPLTFRRAKWIEPGHEP
jgi:flavin reductase (DIM6/NTAB) family NADH-FMN oxidoreductase RutF